MGWKNLSYWLRGGIILGLAQILIYILFFVLAIIPGMAGFFLLLMVFSTMPINIIFGLILSRETFENVFLGSCAGFICMPSIFAVAVSTVFWFIVGTIVSLIIEKIRFGGRK